MVRGEKPDSIYCMWTSTLLLTLNDHLMNEKTESRSKFLHCYLATTMRAQARLASKLRVHPRGQLAANAMSIYVDRSEQETLQTTSTYTTVTRATDHIALNAGYVEEIK